MRYIYTTGGNTYLYVFAYLSKICCKKILKLTNVVGNKFYEETKRL